MSEFIVRETGYPGAVKQEVVGELIRCKDCEWCIPYNMHFRCMKNLDLLNTDDDFCSWAERKTDDKTNKGSSC